MPGILNAKVEHYLAGLVPKRDAVISDMERYAKQHDVPIIGPVVARSIYLLAQISGAKRIFEMGSAIGYSTIWLARAAGRFNGDHHRRGAAQTQGRTGSSLARAASGGRKSAVRRCCRR